MPGQVYYGIITRDSNLRCDQRKCPKWLTITLQEKLIASTLGCKDFFFLKDPNDNGFNRANSIKVPFDM
jgi:hypothetical protein